MRRCMQPAPPESVGDAVTVLLSLYRPAVASAHDRICDACCRTGACFRQWRASLQFFHTGYKNSLQAAWGMLCSGAWLAAPRSPQRGATMARIMEAEVITNFAIAEGPSGTEIRAKSLRVGWASLMTLLAIPTAVIAFASFAFLMATSSLLSFVLLIILRQTDRAAAAYGGLAKNADTYHISARSDLERPALSLRTHK